MPRPRSSDLKIAALALAALALLTAAGALSAPAAGSTVEGSSYSASPGGAKAAYLTLEDLGYDIQRSYEPLTAIRREPAQTVLVLASPGVPFADLDRRALKQFVEDGGIVLVTGAAGGAALGAAHKGDDARTEDTAPKEYQAVGPDALTADAPSITLAPETGPPAFGSEYHVVYGTPEDAAVRAARIGEGRAVWWSGSTPLTNGAIADAGNLALLLNTIGPPGRVVLWDEHYHGHTRSLWSYIAATPLPWAALQALLIGGAAVLAFSRRHGPIRPLAEDPRTSPMEFVDTMGGLYEQAGAASAAVTAARSRLRRVLISASGLSADAPDERLAVAAARRLGADPDELSRLLASTRQPSNDATEALASVQRLQAMAMSSRPSA
jgi:hypothetical protein